MTRNSLLLQTVMIGLAAGGSASRKPLVFTPVTVIDATGAPARHDMTVVITGDRITALDTAGRVTLPEGARVEHVAGKFLIPGLWDMHVHLRHYGPPLFLANGVTGVRFMWGRPHLVRERTRAGSVDPPVLRRSVASPIVDGPDPVHPGSLVVHQPEQARRLKEFVSLEHIGLSGTRITDDGLGHLGTVTRLKGLGLANTRITDRGLSRLAGLAELEFLILNNTAITDGSVSVSLTKVTGAGIKRLREALPQARITH